MNLSKTYFSVFSTQNLIFLFTKFEKPDFLLLSWSTIIFPEILVHLYQAELEMKNVIKWIIDHQPFFSFQLLYPQKPQAVGQIFWKSFGDKDKAPLSKTGALKKRFIQLYALFENFPKCLVWIFQLWHFPPIFVLSKLTCLVTLFDHKLQIFKILALLMTFCLLKL